MPSRDEQRAFNERLKRGHGDMKQHSISMGVHPSQSEAFNETYRKHGITGAYHDPATGILHGDPGAMKKIEQLRNFTEPL